MEIIRKIELIKKLRDRLIDELVTLPDHSIFGESNEEAKKETRQNIRELTDYIEEGKVPDDKKGEIYYWLFNEKSTFASDYGVKE